MTEHIAAVVGTDPESINLVFGDRQYAAIRELCKLKAEPVTLELADSGILRDVEIIFSTWGMIPFTGAQLDNMPNLKAVFYAAGATEYFALPLLQHGIRVSSAWVANAIPVAEYACSQIILGLKNYFQLTRNFRSPAARRHDDAGPGAYGKSVALIGDGAVSRHLQKLLGNIDVSFEVLPTAEAGNDPGRLLDLFSRCQVVSNHLPDSDRLAGLFQAAHFRALPYRGVFINTGRGRQVNEPDLISVLRERPDLTALLDVTLPEPPEANSLLYTLPNVFLSPHLAGSVHDECHRMADYMIEECRRFLAGQALKYEVRAEYLLDRATM